MRSSSKILAAVATLLCLSIDGCGQALSGKSALGGDAQLGAPLVEPTPPMGWNSWLANDEQYYPSGPWAPTEAYIKAQSDALVSSGLSALGYTLMSVDGGWQQRDGSGNLEGIPAQFPDGVAALAAYVHARGLKFGLYGTPGDPCLTGYPSQFGREAEDAATLGSWGVDYWKYDFCGAQDQFPTDAAAEEAHLLMGNALAATGRPIGYLVNAYFGMSPFTPPYYSLHWLAAVGGTVVRVGYDNNATGTQTGWWYWKAQNLDFSSFALYQTKGRWLDPDNLMLQLNEGGPGLPSPTAPVSDAEGRAQFNWYGIIAAPLVIGARITDLTTASLQTLGNAEVIAVDQDPLGQMGTLVRTTSCGSTVCQVWARHLAKGGYAVALINYDPSSSHSITATWSDIGITGSWNVRDLWLHADQGDFATGYTFTAPAWGSTMLVISQ